MHDLATAVSSQTPQRSAPRAILLLLVCMAAGVGIYLISPQKCSWLPGCLFHSITGLYCPGCGLTRCLHALSHGHLSTALSFNPLVVLLVPAAVYLLIQQLYADFVGRPMPFALKPSAGMAWIWLFIVVIFGIARNIPLYPFTLLSPH